MIEIRLLGTRIPLRATEGEPHRIQEVIDLVTRKITEAEARAPKGSPAVQPQHVALLALLDLAEEYLNAKYSVEKHHYEVEARTQELLSMLP